VPASEFTSNCVHGQVISINIQNGVASLICKEVSQLDVKSEDHSMKDESKPVILLKVLLNPVLTKLDVQISDFVIAVGVTLEVSAKSEYHVTAIAKVVVASFVLN
jgi:hypothetical protein